MKKVKCSDSYHGSYYVFKNGMPHPVQHVFMVIIGVTVLLCNLKTKYTIVVLLRFVLDNSKLYCLKQKMTIQL